MGNSASASAYVAGGTLRRHSVAIDLVSVGAAILVIAVVLLITRKLTGRLVLRAEAAYPARSNKTIHGVWESQPRCCLLARSGRLGMSAAAARASLFRLPGRGSG